MGIGMAARPWVLREEDDMNPTAFFPPPPLTDQAIYERRRAELRVDALAFATQMRLLALGACGCVLALVWWAVAR
jgi:hypothetical protein